MSKRSHPVAPQTPDARPLLDRIMETPNLERAVPRLQPHMLHRVIQTCGLENCGELVSLATAEQLRGVLDLDLWRSRRPGGDERLDADRFGEWLEALADAGADVAARTLAKFDAHLVSTSLAQYIRVFDVAVAAPVQTDDEAVEMRTADATLDCEIGGYRIVTRRADAWDAIVSALAALDAERPEYFHRVMRGCLHLSNSTPEIDGLDDLLTDPEQAMYDLAGERAQRRDASGYVTAEQARAFLQASRQLDAAGDTGPAADAIARAYLQPDELPEASGGSLSDDPQAAGPPAPETEHETDADPAAPIVDLLFQAGVLSQGPRALLGGATDQAPRFGRFQTYMRVAHDRAPVAFSARERELAFLANALLAGCSAPGRPFAVQEASDAAIAVCNLGLDTGPKELPDDFLVHEDLVGVFRAGWTVLYEQVCLFAADQLIDVLAAVRCADREIQKGLVALRRELVKHRRAGTPWRAADALDAIASLDGPAWAALTGLIAECPVIHAALIASVERGTRAIDPSAFEFVSESSHLVLVREFMRRLPDILAAA